MTVLITNEHAREEDPPNVAPGDECEIIITPQLPFSIQRIVIGNYFRLVRVRIGAVEGVPFKREVIDRAFSAYSLEPQTREDLLVLTGAAFAPNGSMSLPAGIHVIVTLRNDRGIPSKPQASLAIHQEGCETA